MTESAVPGMKLLRDYLSETYYLDFWSYSRVSLLNKQDIIICGKMDSNETCFDSISRQLTNELPSLGDIICFILQWVEAQIPDKVLLAGSIR
jgi:hypothetical protein